MPKRKTNARKKAERRKLRAKEERDVPQNLAEAPCNALMTCDQCQKQQKNRSFCYFCNAVQRLPVCANCGRTKCPIIGSDCIVRHPGKSAVGMSFVGAVCDFCEAWVCHSRRCVQDHSCPCPLDGAVCVECNRTVANNGGRFFKCFTCDNWLCGEDQFEHQASCQVLESESYSCASCNRFGIWSCLRCKICYCDTHVKSAIKKTLKKGETWPCKKCLQPVRVTKDLSVSTRTHEYGRQQKQDMDR